MGDGGTGEVLRVFGCKQPTTVSCNLENAPFVSDGSSYLMKKKIISGILLYILPWDVFIYLVTLFGIPVLFVIIRYLQSNEMERLSPCRGSMFYNFPI